MSLSLSSHTCFPIKPWPGKWIQISGPKECFAYWIQDFLEDLEYQEIFLEMEPYNHFSSLDSKLLQSNEYSYVQTEVSAV